MTLFKEKSIENVAVAIGFFGIILAVIGIILLLIQIVLG